MVATISSFLCPSDIDRLTNAEGHHNYGFNCGTKPLRYSTSPNGPFICAQPNTEALSFASITDGTSQTAAMSERVKGIGNGNALNNPSPPDPLTPSSVPLALAATADQDQGPQTYYTQCLALPPTSPSHANGVTGGFWANGLVGADGSYNHVMPPNSQTCVYSSGDPADHNHPQGALTASSRHSGIVNVLFCDGSTRPIKSSVNYKVWWSLGTMASGDIVSQSDY